MAKFKWKKKGAKNAMNSETTDPKADKATGQEQAPQENETAKEQPATEQEPAAEEQREASIEEWQAALEKAVAQRDEYLALAQRTQADFTNFRRRNQTIRADAYDDGVRETLAAMLPVIDNLERALATLGEEEGGALGAGLRMTLKQLTAVTEKLGLQQIDAKPGDPFDPGIHNAVMRGEGGEPGTVLDCFEKGYRVKERMLRYASVKVCAE